MTTTQLTPLDTSFLAVESETAHMHVGWVCEFSPPEGGESPSFMALREHIAARLGRAPRYRQRLKEMPLGIGSPSWVDATDFNLDDHLRHRMDSDLMAVAAEAMSRRLDHSRPLWEMTIVTDLPGGGIGVVGKAHHCMVDGIAAVELASLLLDPEPEPDEPPTDEWSPEPPPVGAELLGRGVIGGAIGTARAVAATASTLTSAQAVRALPGRAERFLRTVVDAARPAETVETLNRERLSPERHLGVLKRPLDELRGLAGRLDVTVNDVLLAAVTGGLRDYLDACDEQPSRLKTMVPVNVRGDGEGGPAGNRISFMFVDLPCEEPDPLQRVRRLAAETGERKRRRLPSAGETILEGIGRIPSALRGVVSRLAAGPRAFNLTVSNIPGPQEPMYMAGCRLEAAFPVVPIPEQHALAVGMTSIGGQACFGLYADRERIPDVERIAAGIDRELDELLAAAVRVGEDAQAPAGPGARAPSVAARSPAPVG